MKRKGKVGLVLGAFALSPVASVGCESKFKCEDTLTCSAGPGGMGGEASGGEASGGEASGGQSTGGESLGGMGGEPSGGAPSSGGTCDGACACSDTEVFCDGECIDPQSNSSFCGAADDCSGSRSGVACDDDEACEGGVCVLQCEGGTLECDGACIDPLENQEFCGASGSCSGGNTGEVCDVGEFCLGGECRSWGTPEVVAAKPDQLISRSDLVVAPGGDALITYGSNDWFSRSFDPGSSAWGAERELLLGTSRNTYAVAMFPSGRPMLVYSNLSLFSAYRVPVAPTDWVEFPGQTPGAPVNASLATADGDIAAISWRVSGVNGIWTSFFDPDTETWSPALSVTTSSGAVASSTATSGGRTIVAWEEVLEARIAAALHDGETWETVSIPGQWPDGATRGTAFLNSAGEALVVYNTEFDNAPDETWGVPYSFDTGEWGQHFQVSAQQVTTVAYGEGAFSYGLLSPDERTEIWWAANEQDLTGFPETHRQVLMEQPAQNLVAATNGEGQVVALFQSEGQVYFTRLERMTQTWSEPLALGDVDDSSGSNLRIGLDDAGRAIALWPNTNPAATQYLAVHGRRLE